MKYSPRRYAKGLLTFFPLLRTQRVVFPLRFLRQKRSLFSLLFLSLLIVLLPLRQMEWVRVTSNAITDSATPLLQGLSTGSAEIGDTFANLYQLWDLRHDYARILEEQEQLHAQLLEYQYHDMENRQLRALLNLEPPGYPRQITGRIVADPSGIFEYSLLISTGSNHGVTKGQAVINHRGFVGQIIDVADHSSRVLLLRDYNSRIPVVMDKNLTHAILSGDGHPNPILKYPENQRPRQGENVFTSGRGGRFPPGIAVGKVLSPRKNGEHRVQLFSDPLPSNYVQILDYNDHSPQEIPPAP